MTEYMSKGQTGMGTGAARTQEQDGMSAKTPVVSSAEGPLTQELAENLTAEELANPDSVETYNPNLAETREMINKYIRELDDIKNPGDGTRAIRRQGGTVVMAYGVKRKDFK
jgi:hypothetical protein